jgi:hypothetical protein
MRRIGRVMVGMVWLTSAVVAGLVTSPRAADACVRCHIYNGSPCDCSVTDGVFACLDINGNQNTVCGSPCYGEFRQCIGAPEN